MNREEIKNQAIKNLKEKRIELNGRNITQEMGKIKDILKNERKHKRKEFEKRMEKEYPEITRLERQKEYAEYLRNTPPQKRAKIWKDFGKGMKWC